MRDTAPRIVNAQRMGAKLHWCVEDVPVANGSSWQRCHCGARVVQSDQVMVKRDRDGNMVDSAEYDVSQEWFCKRGCWEAYQAYVTTLVAR